MHLAVPAFLGREPSFAQRTVAFTISCVLLVAVGIADEVTGEHVLVDAFYLIPILIGTWFLGRRWGMFFAVATTVTWAAVRMFGAGYPSLSLGLGLWNALMRLSVMATVAYLLSRARGDGFALRGLLDRSKPLPDVVPICAWCRKLRTESDEWQTLEEFLSDEADVLLTHGICADCAARVRGEMHGTK